eukprot:scaffold244968_cov24-Tisochrysis_lutea.AAC.1
MILMVTTNPDLGVDDGQSSSQEHCQYQPVFEHPRKGMLSRDITHALQSGLKRGIVLSYVYAPRGFSYVKYGGAGLQGTVVPIKPQGTVMPI